MAANAAFFVCLVFNGYAILSALADNHRAVVVVGLKARDRGIGYRV